MIDTNISSRGPLTDTLSRLAARSLLTDHNVGVVGWGLQMIVWIHKKSHVMICAVYLKKNFFDFQGSSFVFCQVLLDWQLSNFAWQ